MMLIKLIEEFNEKYSSLKDKFQSLQKEIEEEDKSSLNMSDDSLRPKSNL